SYEASSLSFLPCQPYHFADDGIWNTMLAAAGRCIRTKQYATLRHDIMFNHTFSIIDIVHDTLACAAMEAH
ncbi:MAG: hypothetical protein RSB47_09145, partial [Ruthenibacterium sp.]